MRITLTIPGEPFAMPRARAAKIGNHVRVYQPASSREWKALAVQFMSQARIAYGVQHLLAGPIALHVEAWFSLPKSHWRKRTPKQACRHVKKPDLDNVVKAIKDAANGVLYVDDSQVCLLSASKWTAAQGDPPSVVVSVTELEP